MIIYIYPKCTTCQKAIRFLKEQNVIFTIKDIVHEPPTKQELELMLAYQDNQVKKLFNTSGILYRQMNLGQKVASLTLDDVLTLLSNQGMLIKRPFLLSKNLGLVGFNEISWFNKLKDSQPPL